MEAHKMPAPNLLRPSALQGRGQAAARFAAAFARGALGASETLALWIERFRQRRARGTLSDHMLKDLGLSRSDAGRESGKRFWEG